MGTKSLFISMFGFRLKDSLDWVDGRFADGFVFRDGKITYYLSFGERLDALQWAGIEEHEII